MSGVVMTLRPEQEEAAAAAVSHLLQCRQKGTRGNEASLLLVSPTGTGKCLRVGTEVLLSDGTPTRVEDVRAGDRLLGPTGAVRTVLNTTRGVGPLFRITPNKGAPYDVTEEHLLSLRNSTTGEVANVTVREYLTKSNYWRHVHKGWRSGVIEFERGAQMASLPVPPYILGLWLGDGTTTRSEITCDREDTPVLAAWQEYGATLPNTKAVISRLTTGRSGSGVSKNQFANYLRATGLCRGKFIPPEYCTASREARRELLAGLLDTDGHLGRGYFDFITKHPHIAHDVAFIARSLGLATYVRKCEKSCQGGFTGTYYRLAIAGDIDTIPTRLPRKRAVARWQRKSVLNVGVTVEPVGDGEYAGFELDGDHLFLLADFTVTHNSFIQGAVHRTIRETHGLTIYSTFPSADIARPVFEKTYGTTIPGGMSEAKVGALLAANGFWTVKKLHNELLAGRVPIPDFLQHDEAHHSVDDTHEVVHGICGLCPRIGATATDYRGTSEETAKLRERWPRMHRVLTLKRAVELGRLSQPSWDVWPLINDELIDVVGGEFKVSKVESHISDKLDDLVDRLRPFRGYDRPTMIAVPGVKAVKMVVEACERAGLPAVGITGETSDLDRRRAFERVVRKEVLLVQIRVVGEGVDLPMRRLIDLAPTVSPVLWMQRVGRITRPVPAGEPPPEYIACCHNLARHAYLWHGVMPSSTVKKAQEAWGKDFKPSRRFLARAINVEGLGRFQPGAIPFREGGYGTVYAMQTKDGLNQFAVVLHPLVPDPWFFGRSIPLTGGMKTMVTPTGHKVEYKEKDYDAPEAKWRRLPSLPDLQGMVSIPPGKLTEPQLAWWKRSAARFGLDPEAEITNREFQVLPVLANSGVRLEV